MNTAAAKEIPIRKSTLKLISLILNAIIAIAIERKRNP
jgi:hypothetical protein